MPTSTKMFQHLSQWSMNSKSIGNNGLEKTALTRFRIQKLQVIRYDENNELKQDSMGFKEKTTVLDKMK